MTTENKEFSFEKTVEVVTTLAKDFTVNDATTGHSYFKGKNRLCKVLNSKKGIRVELNVVLPKAIEDKYLLQPLTAEVAKKKHLGSMKYSVVSLKDTESLKEVIGEALKAFKSTHEAPAVTPKTTDEPKTSVEPKDKEVKKAASGK